MKIDAKITICRTRSSHEDDYISVSVHDDKSGIQFLTMKIGLADFAQCITGLSAVHGEGTVRGLDYIGKKRVSENRSVECPLESYDRKELSAWIDANCQEEGWIVNSSLNSQGSVRGKTLNYSVTKFVEVTP